MRNQKGSVIIFAAILGVLVLGGVIYIAQTKKVSAPVLSSPTPVPNPSMQLLDPLKTGQSAWPTPPTPNQKFEAIVSHLLPQTYTISYVSKFADSKEWGTTLYKTPGHYRLDQTLNSAYVRSSYATPTEHTQCAKLLEGWFCYRSQFSPIIGRGGVMWDAIKWLNEGNSAENVGGGFPRDMKQNISQLQVVDIGEREIAGRKNHCFDTALTTGTKPHWLNCFDVESSLLMENDHIIADAISFEPISSQVFELPAGAIIETELTEKVKSLFFGNHD